jgi:hypothetical protein
MKANQPACTCGHLHGAMANCGSNLRDVIAGAAQTSHQVIEIADVMSHRGTFSASQMPIMMNPLGKSRHRGSGPYI